MRRVVGRVAMGVALVGVGYGLGRAQGIALLSGVVPAAETKLAEVGPWGEFHSYYEGTTTGTAALLVGYANINPGKENHPPHQHADEEFLYLVEGSGKWTLGDRTMNAKAGDVLYSAPNVPHGLRNNSDKPLKFFVMKWKSR